MGRITHPSAAERRKSASVARRLSKRYADNWRVEVLDRQGGVTIRITIKRVGLHIEVATIDWFGFTRSVAETTATVVEEIDAVLTKIENRPLFTIVASSDGTGASTQT